MVSINLFKKFVLSSNYASGPKLGAGEREMDHIVTLPAATGKDQQGLSQCDMGGQFRSVGCSPWEGMGGVGNLDWGGGDGGGLSKKRDVWG